jgi:lantibiotic biosynthesis protein
LGRIIIYPLIHKPDKLLEYSYFNQFAFRTPLYSLQKLQTVLSQTTLEQSVEVLFEFFKIPINQEALFLASPDLQHRLQEYYRGEIKDPSKIDSLAFSLMKYFQRMTTRCTPFGLFASIGTGEISDKTSIIVDRKIANNRHTRIDMNYLCALAAKISQIKEIQEEIKFYPNTSIYVIGEELRFVEYHYQQIRRIHQISSVDFSEYVYTLLQTAKNGATIKTLINSIISEEISEDEAHNFIIEIIDSQLFVSEFEPSVCGDELLFQIINTLEKLPFEKAFEINEKPWTIGSLIDFLKKINAQLEAIDGAEFNEVSVYHTFAENLKILGIETELSKLFQTDLVRKTINGNLDKTVLTDIKETARFLNRITIKEGENKLDKFAKAFYERYEDAEIPLLFALDTETGIGYLQENEPQKQNMLSWNKTSEILLKKILIARTENIKEIALTDDDFDDLKDNWTDQPDTVAFMVELIEEEGEIRTVFSGTGGSGAGNLLGRFSHAEKKINQILENIIEKENNLKPIDTIIAEIVHLPESRTGNILMRTRLREYEIPYLAKPSVSTDFQILPEDLFVSVRGNNVILRSKKLNKIIIPRLTNAHNFGYNSLPMYNFLCDLQTQHMRVAIGFTWGALEATYQFLPRVTYRKTIISPAKWILRKKDFEYLLKNQNNVSLLKDIVEWQKHWNIPQVIQLADADNELLIDLNNLLSIKTFLNTIKKRDSIQLSEFLFTPKNCLISDLLGENYVNQFVFAFHRKERLSGRDTMFQLPVTDSNKTVKRTFVTGEEWLYFKIYCGTKTADQFLKYSLKVTLDELKNKNLIESWFFIRYADPQNHLRIRFKIKNTSDISEVSQILKENCSYFLDHKLIWKLQTDTYNRELERYGASTIEIAEDLFNANSEQILQLIELFDDSNEEREAEIRWFFGLKGVDMLLNAFNFDLKSKKELLENLSEGFGREFNMNIDLKKQLGERFRKERGLLSKCINHEHLLEDDFKQAFSILHQFKERNNQIAKAILQAETLEVELNNLLGSYIHMFMNRLFITNQRYTEMIQYHLLWHFYRSEVAQAK